MHPLKFEFESFSAQGPRPENQDATFSLVLGDIAVFGVADGMGGEVGGKIAADLVVETVRALLLETPTRDLSEVFTAACDALVRMAAAETALRNMGTTLSVCRIIGAEVEVGHVGDTRIYHIRDGGILRRTEDQTEVAELVKQGILTKTQARTYHRKNVLLSALSPKGKFTVFGRKFTVLPNDILILSTDGLHSVILTRELAALAAEASGPARLCRLLEAEVEKRGAEDNYSAICIKVLQ